MAGIGMLVRVVENREEPNVQVRMFRVYLTGGDEAIIAKVYEADQEVPELSLMGPDIDVTMRGVEYLFKARRRVALAQVAAAQAIGQIARGAA